MIEFIDAGVDYVDIDISTSSKLIKKLKNHIKKNHKKTKLIISYHNFKKTPHSKIIIEKVTKARNLGADIIKIATYAQNPEDNLTILNILQKAKRKKIKMAVMCMGKKGRVSRIIGPELGSWFTFVAANPTQKTAPGQLTASEYKNFATFIKNN